MTLPQKKIEKVWNFNFCPYLCTQSTREKMQIPLKKAFLVQSGYFAKMALEGDLVYLQGRHFDEDGGLSRSLHPELSSKEVPEKHILRPNDVLFAAKGTKTFAILFEKHNPPAVASTTFLVLRSINDMVVPEFLVWFLNLQQTKEILRKETVGSAMPSITKEMLEELDIPFLPLKTQLLIIRLAFLDKKQISLKSQIHNLKQKLSNQVINNLIYKNHD